MGVRYQRLKTAFSCLLALSVHWAASTRFGLTPALGPLMSPYEGFWQNAETADVYNVPDRIFSKELRKKVIIRFDSAQVPHIEAQNQADLFFAQGYVCASLRLWQMDFISRAAAGRLSELFGHRALDYDKFQRRFGMGTSADASLQAMLADPETKIAVESYAKGVNAYISNLGLRQIPLEYKILGYVPELWTPLKSAYLLKYMAFTLTGRTDEVALGKAWAAFGPEVASLLYPTGQLACLPVIPDDVKFTFPPLPTGVPSTYAAVAMQEGLQYPADDRNGSNNWALAGSKTATGKPLLANDPHLGLQLPSLWLRMQLQAPGFHVVGVTLPGAPSIIVGHNQAIAWGITNTGADVLDLYKVRFAGRGHYFYKGSKRAFTQRIESFKLPNSEVVLDTILQTHLGPLVYTHSSTRNDVPAGYVAAWVAHQPSNDLAAFLGLAGASTIRQTEKALSHLSCPAQNFAYADTAGHIGMFVAGSLPLRAVDQGKWAQNLENAANVPFHFIPANQNPKAIDPSQGYVASANQRIADANYPYYLNWRFSEHYRGLRIINRLGQMEKATIDSMGGLQMDVYNLPAMRFLPHMLAGIEEAGMPKAEAEILEMLRTWNLRNDSDQTAPSVFEAWFTALQDTVWDELRPGGYPYPMHEQMVDALTGGPLRTFVDVKKTKEVETAQALYQASFQKAYNQLTEQQGAAGKAWNWGRVKHTGISHMARIPGLSVPFVSVPGGRFVVNATSGSHGPSMRMVVSLEKPIRAFGNMPGGQSGNPGSKYYLTELEAWKKGQLIPWVEYAFRPKETPKLMRIWEMQRP